MLVVSGHGVTMDAIDENLFVNAFDRKFALNVNKNKLCEMKSLQTFSIGNSIVKTILFFHKKK